MYEGGGAQAALTALSEAVDACAGGFALAVAGAEQRVSEVFMRVAPEGADQAMAFGVIAEQDGVKAPVEVVVFRRGGTVGYFAAAGTAANGTAGNFGFPAEIVEAQLVKLA